MSSMHSFRVNSYVLDGAIYAKPVTIEVELVRRIPTIVIVGLGSRASDRELAEIVHSAIYASGYEVPRQRVTVTVSPDAALCGEHASLALPIALAILGASGQWKPEPAAAERAYVGSLTLGGQVQSARVSVPAVRLLRSAPVRSLMLPADDWIACVDQGAPTATWPVSTLRDAVEDRPATGIVDDRPVFAPGSDPLDMRDVPGLPLHILDSLIECAAKRTPVLLRGERPGVGCTMLAARLPGILPAPSIEDERTINWLRASARLSVSPIGCTLRPFRAPHHTISTAGLYGTVRHIGEACLAHEGVLFLDNIEEFQRTQLDYMRAVRERKHVDWSSSTGTVKHPADFWLVASTAGGPARSDAEADFNARRFERALSLMGAACPDGFTIVDIPAARSADAEPWPTSVECRRRVLALMK